MTMTQATKHAPIRMAQKGAIEGDRPADEQMGNPQRRRHRRADGLPDDPDRDRPKTRSGDERSDKSTGDGSIEYGLATMRSHGGCPAQRELDRVERQSRLLSAGLP